MGEVRKGCRSVSSDACYVLGRSCMHHSTTAATIERPLASAVCTATAAGALTTPHLQELQEEIRIVGFEVDIQVQNYKTVLAK